MRYLLGCITALLCATAVNAQVIVIDGDTLKLGDVTYRINGIDAPETGQKCKSERGKEWHCGHAATNAMYELTLDKKILCKRFETDKYGRVVAQCFADGQDLGKSMVERGMAWAFVRYSDKYAGVEKVAKRNKLGIWRSKTKPAWEFRTETWAKAQQTAPTGCPIKGNITKSGKIYHAPWSPWYSRTRINTSKGERWFCNEAEAVAAGWRAPNAG